MDKSKILHSKISLPSGKYTTVDIVLRSIEKFVDGKPGEVYSLVLKSLVCSRQKEFDIRIESGGIINLLDFWLLVKRASTAFKGGKVSHKYFRALLSLGDMSRPSWVLGRGIPSGYSQSYSRGYLCEAHPSLDALC